MPLPDIGFQDPGEGSVHPGMKQPAYRIGGVGDDRGEGGTEDVVDVRLIRDAIDHDCYKEYKERKIAAVTGKNE